MGIYGLTPRVGIKRLTPGAKLPTYATDGSAGLDVYSTIEHVLRSGARHLIPVGFAMELPPGYVALVCPRSGLVVNQGITVLNSPGVIDSDYRGEVHVPLYNTDMSYLIRPGHRVGQLLIMECPQVRLVQMDELSDTERGTGGMGSTGV